MIKGRLVGVAMGGQAGGRSPLLLAAAALAAVSGALHIYFAFYYFAAEPPLQMAFIGIGAIYFVGTALGLMGWKHDLVLKGAAVWVVLMIVTWGLGAAYGRSANVHPLALVVKAVEVALFIALFRLMRARKAAPASQPPQLCEPSA